MDLPALFAGFSWWDGGYGPDHWYKETQYGSSPVLAKLEGKVPYHSSPNYSIDNAYTFAFEYGPNIRFYTPDNPGVPAERKAGRSTSTSSTATSAPTCTSTGSCTGRTRRRGALAWGSRRWAAS